MNRRMYAALCTGAAALAMVLMAMPATAAGVRGDVTNLATAVLRPGDVPARYSIEHHKLYTSYATYGKGLPMGKVGNCQETKIPAKDWRQGLAESLVDKTGYGFQECVERLTSDSVAKYWYNQAVKDIRKQKIIFKQLSVPRIGDGSFGLTYSILGQVGDLLFFRHGDTVVAIAAITKGKSPLPISTLAKAAQRVNPRLR